MTEPDNALLVGAQFLGLADDTKFLRQLHIDAYLNAAVTALGKVLIMGEAPEVEVTSSRSLVHVEGSETPVAARRSGAKNVSDPHLQNTFISEARHSMGQPSHRDAEALVGRTVTLVFNVDLDPITGILTRVYQSAVTSYLILDDNDHTRYPLNSIQEIKTA